ncbi:MAG: hypothetical protein K2L49_03470, partial [Muribaculaceae bacterium]|nr:hypothetical protein [Muribaculaceae bacterium]
ISTMLILLFVQCDSAERRKSKAEDAIEKHLFETLDNYQSYEKISTEVDTLQDLWLAHPEIISFAGKLCYVEDNSEFYESLSDNLRAMISKLEPAKEPYWCVTQKFRISEDGQGPKIHTAHYILDHDMNEIIFSWDENDIRTQRLINIVSGIIIGSNEIFDAITEDEE